MGKDRHNRSRRAANRRQHNRANRAHRTNRSRTKSVRYSPRDVAPLTPLSIPWMNLFSRLDPLDEASDGTTCLAIEDGPRTCFAVLGADGVMREFLIMVGPGYLGDIDRVFLEDFLIWRRDLGDPLFADLPPEADEPRPAMPNAPEEGSRKLHYWSYKPFDLAADGSRSVLARPRDDSQTLMVIDSEGRSIDGMWIDPLFDDTADEAWTKEFCAFSARRRAVSDPFFAMFDDVLGSPDDEDVVA
jgi:hypothetical protein